MELKTRIILLLIVIRLSDAEDEKKNLKGTEGGNITLPGALLEFGLLLYGGNVIALVRNTEFYIEEDISKNRLQWNKTSGLFTLTNLQRRDSGIYCIDSKRGRVFTTFYNLTVYDSVAPPAVHTLTVSSDNNPRHHWIIIGVSTLGAVAVVSLTAFLIWKCFRNNKKTTTKRQVAVAGAAGQSGYEPVTAKVGEDVTLGVEDTPLQPGDDLSWSHGPNHTVFITFCDGHLQRSFPDRFQLDERTGSLTIRWLTMEDARLYQCQITNERWASWKFNLTVVAADPTSTPPGRPHDRTHWIVGVSAFISVCILLLLLFAGKLKETTGKCCCFRPVDV